jgi:hypothetical protein
MERKGYLGIYLSHKHAVAVLVSAQADEFIPSGCFSVTNDTDNTRSLGQLLAEGLSQRRWEFADAAVAVDCTMFTQYNLHSEFTEPHQIAQTVKFDAEDVLADDASELTVAFSIIDSDDSGSRLNIFAAQRKVLDAVLADLQTNGLDPVVIEPDVAALARVACKANEPGKPGSALVVIVSSHACYLITYRGASGGFVGRTFLTSQPQDKNTSLARQIRLTIASGSLAEPTECVKLLDTTGSIDSQQIAEQLHIRIEPLAIQQVTASTDELLAECEDRTAFAAAYGAAIGQLTKAVHPDFRADFAPYQGRKVLLEKALRVLSASVTILMLSIGLYFQLRLFTINKYRSRAYRTLEQQYIAVMHSKTIPESMLRKLTTEVGRLKAGSSARQAGEESVTELLTYALEAVNDAPSAMGLRLESISVTSKSVIIAGDTAAGQYNNLFASIDKHPRLQKGPFTYNYKSGRDVFRLTILPETARRN